MTNPWNMTDDQVRQEAASLARDYNWPDEAAQLARGVVPEGFGREVGSYIALFMAQPALGYMGMSDAQAEMTKRENRAHGRLLARLRVLIARMVIPVSRYAPVTP